ncbi:hypothetical protein SMD22_00210 (plasmid) [Brevibacillus halotolerans]|nr:hypothetical protein SMD22_00210 [Brevibacillus halotolerans]
MSKGFIIYLVVIAGIIALVFGGVPYLQDNSAVITQGKNGQVHFVEEVYSVDVQSVKIGNYLPVNLKDLNNDHREFVKDMMDERGIFQKDGVVLLSLGVETPHKKISFVRQDVRSDEVRIYVKIEENRLNEQANDPSYLIGKITMPLSMPISFVDEKTGSLLY